MRAPCRALNTYVTVGRVTRSQKEVRPPTNQAGLVRWHAGSVKSVAAAPNNQTVARRNRRAG